MFNLSAFIQFIGALYISLTVDSTLFKRFWNPDFFAMMSSNIEQYTNDKGVKISTELNNKLTNTARDISNQIDTSSRRQGCMMLIYSVALLVILGFKNHFVGEQMIIASWVLLCFLVLGLISFLFSNIILTNWGAVFITAGLVLLLQLLIFINPITHLLYGVTIPSVWLKIVLVLFLLIPIIWRVFYNWLYSRIYYKYNHTVIKQEYLVYVQTKKYLKDKQSQKIDDRYKDVLSDFYNNEGSQDTVNKCAEIYVDLVTKKCNEIPGVFALLKYRNTKVEEDNIEGNEEIKEMVSPLSNKSTELNQIKQSFEELYIQYEQLKGSKRLQDFCKEKNVDVDAFRKYRNSCLNKKKK